MYLEYKKVKMGKENITKLVNHLISINYQKVFVFEFEETGLLVILDDNIITYLNQLNIRYEIIQPPNSVRYMQSF